MKKIMLCLLTLLTLPSFSQEDDRNHTFGITVGISPKYTDWEKMDMHSHIFSMQRTNLFMTKEGNYCVFQLGVTSVSEFRYGLGLYSGIHFEFAHDKYRDEYFIGLDEPRVEDAHAVFLGMRIPLCLQYRYEFPDGISLLAYTGPTFHYGIVSFLKREASATLVGHQWSIGGGMQYRRLQFRLTGDIPLWQYFLDINAHESGIEVKSPLTFSLSYLF